MWLTAHQQQSRLYIRCSFHFAVLLKNTYLLPLTTLTFSLFQSRKKTSKPPTHDHTDSFLCVCQVFYCFCVSHCGFYVNVICFHVLFFYSYMNVFYFLITFVERSYKCFSLAYNHDSRKVVEQCDYNLLEERSPLASGSVDYILVLIQLGIFSRGCYNV